MDYIDLAADMGWEYMLVDWNWYGPPFGEVVGGAANPDSDITTVEKIEGYLAWKWGLVDNLPSDHPYKDGRPLV